MSDIYNEEDEETLDESNYKLIRNLNNAVMGFCSMQRWLIRQFFSHISS
jgi:hypothetical protein